MGQILPGSVTTTRTVRALIQAIGSFGSGAKPGTPPVRVSVPNDKNFTRGKIASLAHRSSRIRQEIQRLQDMDRAFKDAPDSQISLTDPDARSTATSVRGSGFAGTSTCAPIPSSA